MANMHESIRKYDIADRVAVLGPTLNVGSYVARADLGFGGIALNGVSQDFTIAGKPQVLMDNMDNSNTPWRNRINALLLPPDDLDALVAALRWAIEKRAELLEMGRRAKQDLSPFLAESAEGGARYLAAFQSLAEIYSGERTSP